MFGFLFWARWLQTQAQNIGNITPINKQGQKTADSGNPDSPKGAAATKWSIIGTLG